MWINHPSFILKLNDFETILKIFSSDKLKNENQFTIWQVMHDWIKFDTVNRLKYFEQLLKNGLSFDNFPQQFVESYIFRSDIFKKLSLEFQNNIKDYVNKKPKPLLVCIDKANGLVEIYDPQHNSWHTSPVSLPLPKTQTNYRLSLLGSMLYAFSGIDDKTNATNEMWSRDLSDPSSQWTARADMKQSRWCFCSVVLNDTIYALGGKNYYNHYLRSCERYDRQLNEWSTVADMKSGRDGASAAVINGCIYVAGGWNRGVFKSVSKYCPETDTWREVAPMTTKRYVFSLTPFAGRLWAIGGKGGDFQPLSSCESYDPVTDTWREEAPMKGVRWRHEAIEFNGELYVVNRFGIYGKITLMEKSFFNEKHLI